MKDKKAIYLFVGIALLIVSVVGVTYAFFNYTRTGSANNFSTGRIYFNSTQNGKLELSNIFPVKASEVDASTLDSVSVNVLGDTTYTDGEEFQVTLVDVENTVNGKKIPINYIATYTANTDAVIGTSSSDYWNARNNKDASIYTLESTGSVEEGKQVLVGYIDNGATGINGTLTIKAYIDKDRIAITDTPEENSEWQQGRTILTTEEWNSFQTNSTPISFKIRAESNEGIWVQKPSKSIESCPGCKFMYYVVDPDNITTAKWTTWNQGIWDDTNSEYVRQTPTQITSGLYDNYEELIATTGKNYFLGVKLNGNNEVTNAYACGVKDGTPFCIEGTSDGSKYADNQALLQGADLWNNTCTVGSDYVECGPWDDSGSLSAYAYSYGFVHAGVGDDDSCGVNPFGSFACIESEKAPTMEEMCPDCVFAYSTAGFFTTWNTDSQTPSVLTSSDYSANYEDVIATSGKNHFLGLKLNGSNEIEKAYACGLYNEATPFCIEGYYDDSKYARNKEILQNESLWNNKCQLLSEGMHCSPLPVGLVNSSIYINGGVHVEDSGTFCSVERNGLVKCDNKVIVS